MKYWHFLPDNGCLQYGTKEKVKIGHTLMHPPDFKPVLCVRGFHASTRAIDALKYAPGSLICLVTLHGKIVHGDDKSVAQGRTVIAMADATNVLHEIACRYAEQALTLTSNPDPQSVAAIAAKRAWLKGELTDKQLAAAARAAEAGAEAGAAAARAAAAKVKVWEAAAGARAEAAAGEATTAKMWVARVTRVWAGAEEAGAAAEKAAEVVQNKQLETMLYKLFNV